MGFSNSYQVLLGLILLFQVSDCTPIITTVKGLDKSDDMENKFLWFTLSVTSAIAGLLSSAHSEARATPKDMPDKLVDILRSSINCIEDNNKPGKDTKPFFKCFTEVQDKLLDTFRVVNHDEDSHPKNMTPPNYDINLSTTHTETFNIYVTNISEAIRELMDRKESQPPCRDKHHHRDDDDDDDDYDDDDDFDDTYLDWVDKLHNDSAKHVGEDTDHTELDTSGHNEEDSVSEGTPPSRRNHPDFVSYQMPISD